MTESFTESSLPTAALNPTAESQLLMIEILTAATKLMRKKGFLGTTVEDLVEAVGIPKGKLYYHIGTKEKLLYRIHEHVTNEGLIRWQAILETSRDESATIVLERMICEHCLIIETYRDWIAVFTEEMKYLSPSFQAQIRLRRREYQGLLESVLEKGVRDGEFKNRPIHSSASMIIGELNSIYRWYSPEGRVSAGELGEMICSLILNGVRVKQSGASLLNE